MHNGFVNIDDEKMSKSLGNFFTVREVLPKLRHPEVLRYFILSSHYRGPINYSLEQLEQADSALLRIYTALRDLPLVAAAESDYSARFREVMDDDFNTSEAIAVLQNITREINSAKAAGQQAQAAALGAELRSLGAVLGLAQVDPQLWARLSSTTSMAGRSIASQGGDAPLAAALTDADIDGRIAARLAARTAKNWAESDRIRDELAKAGVILEDKPGGTTSWRRA
jgi:cysteinyl-tRNA synthetase